MKSRRAQSGVTLVMSLIMLIVLTMLVVSAIRFSNINLRLAGNSQIQAESTAAVQVAIDKMIKDALDGENLSTMAAGTSTVSTGGTSYSISVAKPKCNMTKAILMTELDPSVDADLPCFGLGVANAQISKSAAGVLALTTSPSACKSQMWDLQASVGDPASGSSVSITQGAGLRVSAEVACPT